MAPQQLREDPQKTFERFWNQIDALLEKFGKPDSLLGLGDYSVYSDYWGYPQVKVSVGNLELLRPQVVMQLQKIASDFPGWDIVVAVAVREHYDWPEMGLIIRGNEIIDGLQQRYFPKEFQNLNYKGSRPGTEND